jgi:cell division inhibitor SepF
MAGAMRKMAVYLGLVEDDRYDEDDVEQVDEPGDQARPTPEGAVREVAHAHRSASVAPLSPRAAAGHGPVAAASPVGESAEAYRITTIHPRTYNEAKQIGETFRDNIPVIMNLTEMDDADAKRLVDFAAGLVFGLRGTIERVTNKVFLLSPVNVAVTAEDKARFVERSFFNQS